MPYNIVLLPIYFIILVMKNSLISEFIDLFSILIILKQKSDIIYNINE